MEKRFADENFPLEIQEKADQMNLDRTAVPPYSLPKLPVDSNTTGCEFQTKIRPQLVRTMADTMYGAVPPRCGELIFRSRSEGTAFGGLALRRETDIICRHNGMERTFHMLTYLPKTAAKPVPLLFGLNFKGNHTTTCDPGVTFFPFTPFPTLNHSPRFTDSRQDESHRGCAASSWEFEAVLKAGFGAATICYYDAYPDHPMGFESSIMRMFYTPREWQSPDRPTGAISAWVWCIERALDCLETMTEVDHNRIAVHGHSRLGKTALWAGANDCRIALTVSNCSGTCGAKLCHRFFGEDFRWIGTWNPHWLRGSFYQYMDCDLKFPADQHFLMAAIAPRLLYVASATDDVYADPEGEFAAAVAAAPAWRLFGGSGLGTTVFPAPGKLSGHEIGYYLRSGGHAFTPENWQTLIAFASRHWNASSPCGKTRR